MIASHSKITSFLLGGKEYKIYTTPWIGWIYWAFIIGGTLIIIYSAPHNTRPNKKAAAAFILTGFFIIAYPIYATHTVYTTNAKENTIHTLRTRPQPELHNHTKRYNQRKRSSTPTKTREVSRDNKPLWSKLQTPQILMGIPITRRVQYNNHNRRYSGNGQQYKI